MEQETKLRRQQTAWSPCPSGHQRFSTRAEEAHSIHLDSYGDITFYDMLGNALDAEGLLGKGILGPLCDWGIDFS
jgi:hypothetical protein